MHCLNRTVDVDSVKRKKKRNEERKKTNIMGTEYFNNMNT